MTVALRVLIADDEADVRLLLRLQLQGMGHEVVGEAADGATTLELCRADPPDVIVLDLLMPGTNGFEVIPAVRGQLPDVAIVAYTAVAGDFVRNEMKRLRVPLVLKTANAAPLATAMRTAVDQVRAR
jgi:two-component system nitrate/nitrite response regulator NarL